jgi:hypothetical protein
MATPGAYDAGAVEVRLGADFQQAGFDKFDRAVEAARRHKKVEAELGASVDAGAFDAFERHLAKAEASAKRRKAFRAALGADYSAAGFREYERALDRARRERDVKTRLELVFDRAGLGGWYRSLKDAERGADDANRSHRSLGQTLRAMGWGALITSIGPVVAGLGALGAGAVEAAAGLAPLVGVIATLPELAAAAGQGLGVLVLAGAGVVQTLKAYIAVDKGAAQQAQTSASQRRSAAASIEAAMRSQADAARGVHDAERQLTDAERQAKVSEQDLTKARRDAAEQLKQLKFQAEDAALAEAGASLSLAEARDHLRQVQEDPAATAFDLADAQRTLAEAKQARVESIDQAKTTKNAYENARHAGVDRMPDVVQARRQYADAERAVQQASRGVQQAQLQEQRATQDLARARADAAAGGAKQTAAQSEYQRQLKQLDPAARSFVQRLISLRKEGESLIHSAQHGFFPGAEKGLNASLPLLGRAKTAIGETAGVMGHLTQKVGEFLGSKGFGRDFTQITHENALILDRAGSSGIHLWKALDNIVIAAQPLTDWISRLTLGWSKQVDQLTAVGRKNGDLARFFGETKHVLSDVFRVVGGLGGAVWGTLKQAYPFGKKLLDGLGNSAQRLSDIVNSPTGQHGLHDFFANAQAPLHELWLGLGDLARVIGSLFDKQMMDALTVILHALRVDVIPAIGILAHSLGETIVPAAAKAIGAVAHLLHDLAPGLKPLMSAIGTLIDLFTNVINFVDSLTQDLPGVTKLIPLLLLGGASWLGWKTLLHWIGLAKTRMLEYVGISEAAGSGPGGWRPAGRGAGARRPARYPARRGRRRSGDQEPGRDHRCRRGRVCHARHPDRRRRDRDRRPRLELGSRQERARLVPERGAHADARHHPERAPQEDRRRRLPRARQAGRARVEAVGQLAWLGGPRVGGGPAGGEVPEDGRRPAQGRGRASQGGRQHRPQRHREAARQHRRGPLSIGEGHLPRYQHRVRGPLQERPRGGLVLDGRAVAQPRA